MSQEMYRTQSGWRVCHPYTLQREPDDRNDLVTQITLQANFEIDDLYPSEADAWKVERGYLERQAEQASKDLDFLSRPFISPSGEIYTSPPKTIEAWRRGAEASLRIAKAGLALCPPQTPCPYPHFTWPEGGEFSPAAVTVSANSYGG